MVCGLHNAVRKGSSAVFLFLFEADQNETDERAREKEYDAEAQFRRKAAARPLSVYGYDVGIVEHGYDRAAG